MLIHDRYASAGQQKSGSHHDAWERYQGYQRAMAAAGLQPLVVTHSISGDLAWHSEFTRGGQHALDQLLAAPVRATAVVCFNDLQAYGLLRGCRLRGLSVPGDLAITGCGDMDLSDVVQPRLTNLAQPSFEAGQQAIRSLMALIAGQPAASVMLQPALVIRDSA